MQDGRVITVQRGFSRWQHEGIHGQHSADRHLDTQIAVQWLSAFTTQAILGKKGKDVAEFRICQQAQLEGAFNAVELIGTYV